MAAIRFEVRQTFDSPARDLWDELIDWKGHERWIPATRVEVDPGDATAVGATFVAYTGFGRLSLEDRMRIVRCDWDEASSTGTCEIEKLGPVLRGSAGFTVTGHDGGSLLNWFEDVRVPYLPQLLAPLVGKISAAGFRLGMRRLARLL